MKHARIKQLDQDQECIDDPMFQQLVPFKDLLFSHNSTIHLVENWCNISSYYKTQKTQTLFLPKRNRKTMFGTRLLNSLILLSIFRVRRATE